MEGGIYRKRERVLVASGRGTGELKVDVSVRGRWTKFCDRWMEIALCFWDLLVVPDLSGEEERERANC
jgi:hypothetical protein